MNTAGRIKRLCAVRKELERKVSRSGIIVVLMGAGGQGLRDRRRLRHSLLGRGVLALVPEDDFPKDVALSLVEKAILLKGDIDLAFIDIQSWGTATEFGQFHEASRIARKLRVLVAPHHHPLHGRSRSYLTDLYLTHLAVYGHVYPAESTRRSRFPTVNEVVVKLALRYSQWKAMHQLGDRLSDQSIYT